MDSRLLLERDGKFVRVRGVLRGRKSPSFKVLVARDGWVHWCDNWDALRACADMGMGAMPFYCNSSAANASINLNGHDLGRLFPEYGAKNVEV